MSVNSRNSTMLMDLYELTMAQTYFKNGSKDQIVTFDMFYRKNPDNAGFSVFAGLAQLIEYINQLEFKNEDIEYLRTLNLFEEDFLNYLSTFKFNGDIYSVEEGSVVFPNEPLIVIKSNIIEAQLIETALLVAINHQSLIATKALRIVRSAQGKGVVELGARRAHNFDSSVYGARAAYIGGVDATSNVLTGQQFNIPVIGTMAHSYIQFFDSEYEAFKTYAQTYPDNTVLLIDTYNTIESGLVNAIRVHKEVLEPIGKALKGVRIDSGDIAYLSKKVRRILDENGLLEVKIIASNSLDEYIIKSLNEQGSKIDLYGVGENLICSKSTPVFGGVYKLSSVEKNGMMIPKIKLSDNITKMTNPAYKKLYRIYDSSTHKASADLMISYDEEINEHQSLTIYHPNDIWKNKRFEAGTYYVKNLHVPIFINGKQVYQEKSLDEIREFLSQQLETIWDEVKRFEYPQEYYVDLSYKLLNIKLEMLNEIARREK